MASNITFPTSTREVVSICKKYDLHPQKNWGQNFLVDNRTAVKIIKAAEVKPGEPVVEIGPGLGALTLPLAREGARVLALEIDAGFYQLLQDLLGGYDSVQILHGDALAVTWKKLIADHFGRQTQVKLLSNLPYSISTPLLYRLLEERFPFSMAVVMLQAEVAERLSSPPGSRNYSSLSVLSQYYTGSSIVFRVPRHFFWPRPQVDSAVVRLEPRAPLLEMSQEPLFWQTVKGVFQVRRKTILNGLLNTFSWERKELLMLLQESGIDPLCRPETLSVEEFANLALLIYNKISK